MSLPPLITLAEATAAGSWPARLAPAAVVDEPDAEELDELLVLELHAAASVTTEAAAAVEKKPRRKKAVAA